MKNVFYSGHLDKRRERTSDKKYVPPKNEVKSVAVLQCCNAFLTKLLKMKKKSRVSFFLYNNTSYLDTSAPRYFRVVNRLQHSFDSFQLSTPCARCFPRTLLPCCARWPVRAGSSVFAARTRWQKVVFGDLFDVVQKFQSCNLLQPV
jgi:hypothetical protein